MTCPGSSLEAAIADAGIGLHQVLSAKPVLALPAIFTRIAAKEQLLVLMRLQPLLAAGRATEIPEQLSAFPAVARVLRRKPHLLDDGLNLSTRLEGLGFDAGAVTMIRAGEESGQVAENLRSAVEYLSASVKLAQQTSRSAYAGGAIFAAAVVALLAVSASLHQPLTDLQNLSYLSLDLNVLSETLLALGWFVINMGWLLVPLIVAAGIAGYRHWEKISVFWPLSNFRAVQNTSRSLRLAMIWESLLAAGCPIEKNPALVTAAVGKGAAQEIFAGLQEGRTFSDLLTNRWFSPALVLGCQRLADTSPGDYKRSLNQLASLLVSEKDLFSRRAARVFYLSGVGIGGFALALLVGGILFPVYSSGMGLAQ